MSTTTTTTIQKSIKCDKKLTFEECELAILRASVDLAQNKLQKRIINSPEIQKMIYIVEDFIKIKNLICYGGQAINELLPKQVRFYNPETDIPDYDFFSPNALEHAKEISDIFYNKGYTDVESKAGQHHGTYKIFVNYIPIADITYIPKELFNTLKKDSTRIAGILYAPVNFLRMSMFLELSRPAGDVERWEKVLKRLELLNKYEPLTSKQCSNIDFQRKMINIEKNKENDIYENIKNTLINQDVVFFGGYALSNYSRYMPKNEQLQVKKVADFDVICNDPLSTSEIIKERLNDINIKNVKIVKRPSIGDVIPEQIEIRINNEPIAVLYYPIGCHSYNTISINSKKVKIATIDTMLSFYLAFLYANKPYYDSDRIICMAKFLFDVQQKNRLEQKGLLRRFTITCYGHQDSISDLRAFKAKKFNELKNNKNTKEYEEWFLNYKPGEKYEKNIKFKPSENNINYKNKFSSKKNKTHKKYKNKIINPFEQKPKFNLKIFKKTQKK